MRYLILLLILSSCAIAPGKFAELTPAECRAYGVGVIPGSKQTGKIERASFGTYAKTAKECYGEYGWLYSGCAKPADGSNSWPATNHKYEIWYADSQCTAYHEACHALYESRHHTARLNLREMQGDIFAACPA